ncbi:MAG: ubiquinone biosynthesis protein [Firmicutes bacterium HGW-Firmicutes-14]|nr:MAG: ubiquinone biosynthesis protein [Firmicutes bacterium HGW-Firmicutes-14]
MNIILRLKEFYLLEMFQLTLYESQLSSIQNEYIEHAYERMVELERHHVDFYKKILNQFGEDVPKVFGGLTSLAGHFLGGFTLDLTTAENRYKLGIAVENKAIEMYRVFIMETWEYPEIRKRAFHNMVDEEFHLLWYKDNLKHVTSLTQST